MSLFSIEYSMAPVYSVIILHSVIYTYIDGLGTSQGVLELSTNTMPFTIEDLSIRGRFWTQFPWVLRDDSISSKVSKTGNTSL